MQKSTEPKNKTPAEGRTEITPIIAHPLALAILLSLTFSLAGLFLIVIVPHELNRFLENYIADPWYAPHPYQGWKHYESVIAFLSPIAYISFWLMIITIIIGVIIKRYKLSFLGSLSFYLPIFGSFARMMGPLYIFSGIGVSRTLWLPVLDQAPELLNLGAILYFPLVVILLPIFPIAILIISMREPFLQSLLGEEIAISMTYLLGSMIVLYIAGVGFFIFTFAMVTWLYGRFQGRKVIDFWIYRYSRHPQYLGLIIWNYGLLMLSLSPPVGLFPPTFPFLVLFLVIIGMALNEEITMIRQHTEEYIPWRERTPFLVPLPRRIRSFITYPMRKVIKKEWPENNKDIVVVLLIYGGIVVLMSVPLLNIPLYGR